MQKEEDNDHAHEDVIVPPNGRITLHWLLLIAISDALAAYVTVTHRTEPSINGLRRPTFFLPAANTTKTPEMACKHPTAPDVPAVIMLPGMA